MDAEHAPAAAPAAGYWRPGCPFCERLMRDLEGDDRIVWIDVWEDPDASELVRSVNGGNEVVPTVLVGDHAMTNPTADEVREALDAAAAR